MQSEVVGITELASEAVESVTLSVDSSVISKKSNFDSYSFLHHINIYLLLNLQSLFLKCKSSLQSLKWTLENLNK